jgi:uncharacterized protein YjeT (DUF2065 family)
MMSSFGAMFRRLRNPEGQSRTARTVEIFGWILLVESLLIFLAPRLAASLLRLPALETAAANYFRLVGLLVGGLGILYVVSGRLNSEGFAFASLFDRPLVPLVMAVLWPSTSCRAAGARFLRAGFRQLL